MLDLVDLQHFIPIVVDDLDGDLGRLGRLEGVALGAVEGRPLGLVDLGPQGSMIRVFRAAPLPDDDLGAWG